MMEDVDYTKVTNADLSTDIEFSSDSLITSFEIVIEYKMKIG